MRISRTETFDDLRRRLGGSQLPASARAIEGARLLAYLRDAGCNFLSSAGLLDAVGSLANDEEIAAHRCLEGVAISHASDGWWLLFRHDDPLPDLSDRRDGQALPHTGDRT